jgi:hypothetical protein
MLKRASLFVHGPLRYARGIGDYPGFGKDLSRIILKQSMELERTSKPHGISASIPDGHEPQVLPHHDPLVLLEHAREHFSADPVDNGEFQLTATARDYLSRANRFVPYGGESKSLAVAGPSGLAPLRGYSTTAAALRKHRKPQNQKEMAQLAAIQGTQYFNASNFGPSGALAGNTSVVDSIGEDRTGKDENIPGAAPLALDTDENGVVIDPCDFREVHYRVLVNPFLEIPVPGRNKAFSTPVGKDLKGHDYASEHVVDLSNGKGLQHADLATKVQMNPEKYDLNLREHGGQINELERDRKTRAASADATANGDSLVSPSSRNNVERRGGDADKEGASFVG